MSKRMYTEEYIQDIAAAIREKNKKTDKYTVSEMPAAIRELGDNQLDKLIDWELYSHPSAFDSIAMPENYSDYTHLLLAIKTDTTNAEWFEYLLKTAYKYYQDKGALPSGYGSVFLIIPTNTITATDQNVNIPILAPYNTWPNAFVNYTPGQTRINSSRILGYNYSGNWQNYQLVMYGVNILDDE